MDLSFLLQSKPLGVPLLGWIPLLPLAGAAFNLVFGRWCSRRTVHAVAIASVFASCVIAALFVFGPLLAEFRKAPANAVYDQSLYTWIEVGKLKLELAFRLDPLSAVMILIVTFVGLLIHIYSTGYMAADPRYAAFFGYMNLFMGSMLILVLAANMPVMFAALSMSSTLIRMISALRRISTPATPIRNSTAARTRKCA